MSDTTIKTGTPTDVEAINMQSAVKISPRPSGVTVFPDHKVYYFEGWAQGARADEFVRRVRATGRKVTMACHDNVNYTMVTVRGLTQ